MFDAPLGQHVRATQNPVEHRFDIHLVSQTPFHSTSACSHTLQATPELADNSFLLERAELHYRNCNTILDA
jgi:hypothetical protein